MGQRVEEGRQGIVETIEISLNALGLPQPIIAVIMNLIATHTPDRAGAAAASAPVPLGEVARSFQKTSLLRSQMLGRDVIHDSSWNMLLDMFASGEASHRLSIGDLVVMSGAPQTTALRQIDLMVSRGLVKRTPDARDGRRCWVELSAVGRDQMLLLIEQFLKPVDAGIARGRPAQIG